MLLDDSDAIYEVCKAYAVFTLGWNVIIRIKWSMFRYEKCSYHAVHYANRDRN